MTQNNIVIPPQNREKEKRKGRIARYWYIFMIFGFATMLLFPYIGVPLLILGSIGLRRAFFVHRDKKQFRRKVKEIGRREYAGGRKVALGKWTQSEVWDYWVLIGFIATFLGIAICFILPYRYGMHFFDFFIGFLVVFWVIWVIYVAKAYPFYEEQARKGGNEYRRMLNRNVFAWFFGKWLMSEDKMREIREIKNQSKQGSLRRTKEEEEQVIKEVKDKYNKLKKEMTPQEYFHTYIKRKL
ncbi:MAG: hypothetical protein QW735_03670 [archaeon]